jgi:hypothetical protein
VGRAVLAVLALFGILFLIRLALFQRKRGTRR